MATIELLSPEGVSVGNAVPLAKGIPTLEDRVVGLLDNSKSGTRTVLDELLRSEYGVSRALHYDKKAAALPAPDEVLEAATRECDVVINGKYIRSGEGSACRATKNAPRRGSPGLAGIARNMTQSMPSSQNCPSSPSGAMTLL